MSARSDSFNAGLRLAYLASARETLDRLASLTTALNVPLEGARHATTDKGERLQLQNIYDRVNEAARQFRDLATAVDELGSQPILPAPVALAAE